MANLYSVVVLRHGEDAVAHRHTLQEHPLNTKQHHKRTLVKQYAAFAVYMCADRFQVHGEALQDAQYNAQGEALLYLHSSAAPPRVVGVAVVYAVSISSTMPVNFTLQDYKQMMHRQAPVFQLQYELNEIEEREQALRMQIRHASRKRTHETMNTL